MNKKKWELEDLMEKSVTGKVKISGFLEKKVM